MRHPSPFAIVTCLLLLVATSTAGFAEEDVVAIDFDNVDIHVVLTFMSQISGKHFIVDNDVSGKVTVVAAEKIPTSEAYALLESVLDLNGFSLVPGETGVRLVSSGKRDHIAPALSLGKELAQDLAPHRLVTQLMTLDFAQVSKVQTMIKPLLSETGRTAVYVPTNTLIVTDRVDRLQSIIELVQKVDRDVPHAGKHIHYYKVKYASAEALARAVNSIYEKTRQLASRMSDSADAPVPFVVPYPEGNALVINALPEEYNHIMDVVDQLDSPSKQIFVEGLIAEVSLEKSLAFGIDWLNIGDVVYGTAGGFSGTQTGIVRGIVNGGGLGQTAVGVVKDVREYGSVEIPKLGALVTMSQTSDDINILSMPQLLTTDNMEAEIFVGENRSFLKNSQTTPEGSVVRTFEFRNIGLLLRITPHVCAHDRVRLDILQEVESIKEVTFEGAVQTSKKRARTSVVVDNGQTVVIGGLVNTQRRKDISKIPLLGDIPVLGLLFRKTKEVEEKKNLLIFITPRLVDTDIDEFVVHSS